MFNRFKSLVLTPHNNVHSTVGNVNFEGIMISLNNKVAYRYDSRSPDTIKVSGFSGTLSRATEEVRVFGHNNVFSSRTKQGAKEFLQLNKFTGQEKIQNLYEIDTRGLQTFSFVENYRKNPIALIESIADLALSGLQQGFSKDEARLFARDALNTQFNFVDELHINGPIPPSRIKHLTTILVR